MPKGLAAELEAVIGGNDEQQEVNCWLDTGFKPLNKAISSMYNGGAPGGRIMEIYGGESCGKTAIATKIMIAAQKAGGLACFMDHERSFALPLAVNMGLNPEEGWVFKTPDTFEKSMVYARTIGQTVREKNLIEPEAPIVLVFDSLASMVPQQKLAKDADEMNMNDNTALARCTSSAFPALTMLCEKHNMLAIFLNQIRDKIGVMYGDKTTSPGGNAPRFYASVRIKLTRSQISDPKDKRIKLGQRVTAECVKNKVSAPFQRVEWDFLYMPDGSGKFDVIGSSIDYCVEKGLLETPSKGYILWDGKKYRRNQLKQLCQLKPEVWDQVEGLMSDD